MNSDRNALKNIAEKKYFELLQYFENDRGIAKALAPCYGRSIDVLKRNLELFTFRNQKSTQDFIDAANVVLAKIKVQKINATALLLIGFDMSPIVLGEQAKKLIDLGINVIAPQAIIENTHGQFWDYIKADIALAVKIGGIRTANRNISGHCIGTYPDSKSLDIRTLFAKDRYVRTA